VLDFAGGMVIHVSSGVSSYVLAYLIGGPVVTHRAHNKVLVLLGAALLWFGWFGFNAGSAVSAGYQAGLALTNTQLATGAAMLIWNLMEVVFDGETLGQGFPTAIGTATAIVAGLVGITPSAGLVAPMWAIFIGSFTAASVFFAPRLLKKYLGVNDVLDCFAVHGVGGMVGAALTGLFANPTYSNIAAVGSFYRNAVQLGIQCAGITVTIVYSAIGTALIYGFLYLIARGLGQTLSVPSGMAPDVSQHGEKA
jgi:Amt family ammonium transporter